MAGGSEGIVARAALLARCRDLRRNGTDAEAVLWAYLRRKAFGDVKFRRQHPCGPYILDFYCPARRLAVELDGGQHFLPEIEEYDRRRTAFLAREGVEVLRFQNDLVFSELASVLEAIYLAVSAVPSP